MENTVLLKRLLVLQGKRVIERNPMGEDIVRTLLNITPEGQVWVASNNFYNIKTFLLSPDDLFMRIGRDEIPLSQIFKFIDEDM